MNRTLYEGHSQIEASVTYKKKIRLIQARLSIDDSSYVKSNQYSIICLFALVSWAVWNAPMRPIKNALEDFLMSWFKVAWLPIVWINEKFWERHTTEKGFKAKY